MDKVGNRTMRDLLDEQVARHPRKNFIEHEDAAGQVTAITYLEFQQRVSRLASGLWDLGIRPDDRVAVFLGNCPEILEAWFALASIGAAMVPSNTANTGVELVYVLEFSGAIAIITEPKYLDVVTSAADRVPAVRHRVLARAAEPVEGTIPLSILQESTTELPIIKVDSDSVVQMLFTSGTTSKPKAVLLTHANALHGGDRESSGLALDATDRCITALPIFHVNAQVVTVLSSLTVGGTCIIIEEFRATKFWDQVRAHKATQVSIVAMQARTLLAQPERETDSDHHLRRTFFALNISLEEKDRFEQRFQVELINAYGLSEAMTLLTLAPVFGAKRWPSIGLPSGGRNIRLIDDEGNDVPTGEVGQIIVAGIAGRTIMKGYHNNPEATAKAIRNGWLYTGDSAYADELGYLYWFDRSVDMIKRAGENISTLEVEGAIGEHPEIAEVAVIGIPDPIRDQAVMAIVVRTAGSTVSADELRAFCAERLSKFKVPSVFEFRESLPKTSIGKVSKGLLRAEAPLSA
jgi:crotonobetaine/carnitine-CoA ligase